MNHNYNNDGCDAGQNKFRLITIVGVVRHPTYMCFGLIFSPKLPFQLKLIVICRISIYSPSFLHYVLLCKPLSYVCKTDIIPEDLINLTPQHTIYSLYAFVLYLVRSLFRLDPGWLVFITKKGV